MLFILKLVCLLQKNRKDGYVVNIKTSMLIVEITGMLYIRYHKIRFLRVLRRERDSSKLLHLDVVYLSLTSASVFRRRLPWFGASMRTLSGKPSGRNSTYTPAYTEKCKPCLLCGMFGARSSSGIDHSISRKECVTVVDVWGTCGTRERCLGWRYRGMRRNTYSRTSSREIEALLDHLDQLGVTVQPHLRRRSGSKFPFISHRLQHSAFPVCYF